jgi:hypothetical protein
MLFEFQPEQINAQEIAQTVRLGNAGQRVNDFKRGDRADHLFEQP